MPLLTSSGSRFIGGARSYKQRILGTQAASLLGYWPLDEATGTTAYDKNGTRNGAYAGGAAVSYAAATSPSTKPAPIFDGSAGFVNLQGTALANAFNGAAGSIMAFCKLTNAATWTDGARHDILSVLVDGSNYLRLRKESVANELIMSYDAGGTLKSCITAQETWGGWMHWALTWSKAENRLIGYLNGFEYARQTGLGTWAGTPAQMNIAANLNSPLLLWPGSVADVALWSAELSASEVKSLAANLGVNVPVFFGDSITSGTGASDVAHRYANLVAASQSWPFFWNNGISATVLQNTTQNKTAVLGGAATNNGRDTYAARVTQYSPSWVVILYGLNDLRLNDAAFTDANFANDLGEVIDAIVTNGTPANRIVIGSPPYIPNASYSLGTPFNGGNSTKHAAYVTACSNVATAKGTRYADVYGYMVANGGDTLISADNIHPNDTGHAAIATCLLAAMA